MKLLWNPAYAGPCVLVLGMFDGVHRGHQALLMEGDRLRKKYRVPLNVYTFEPHPLERIRPDLAPPLLSTLPERAALMAGFGVDALCVADFTPDMRDQTPEEYLAEVMQRYQPRAVVCGFNFTFGAGGRGNGEMLKQWGEEHGVEISIVENVRIGGETVSSTRIRNLLKNGDVREAARLMGHPYTLCGPVILGRQIGRQLGWPTANVHFPKKRVLPAWGVYACWLQTNEKTYRAVVNVGEHPTLPGGGVTAEAHVLDCSDDFYGKRVRLVFLKALRRERTFENASELAEQIRRDTEEAARFFDGMR